MKLKFSCRVYTENRSLLCAGSLGSGSIKQLGLLSLAYIAIHNLITIDPDFEIGRNFMSGRVNITYKNNRREKMNRELLEVIAGQALNYSILIMETDEVFSNLYDEGLLDISKNNEEEYENYKEKAHYFIKFIYDEELLDLPDKENNDEKLIFTHKIKLIILLFNEIYKDTTPEMTDEEFRQLCK
ncbi:hypothetical protein INT80_10785 [Gallibacterium anatis]|uniref:Uncharacterized protein n=1 Tax=Gallibacterium anatis TaxID=750 RepID=A0A930UXA8_9PAST|nr:hypothetical protein [Gallibacterium anatis]